MHSNTALILQMHIVFLHSGQDYAHWLLARYLLHVGHGTTISREKNILLAAINYLQRV